MCEDAIEVVYSSHVHDKDGLQHYLQDFDRPDPDQMQSKSKRLPLEKVLVTLDIQEGDWLFDCMPGAIQRVIINLVANSLKFTKSGRITIKLEKYPASPMTPGGTVGISGNEKSIVKLTVTDTGIGISNDFLRFKLYTPFCQESTLVAGTGKSYTHFSLSSHDNMIQVSDSTSSRTLCKSWKEL